MAPCSANATGSLDDAPDPVRVWALGAGSDATTASCDSVPNLVGVSLRYP